MRIDRRLFLAGAAGVAIAPALAEEKTALQVIELRQYTLKGGTRAAFTRLFEREFVVPQNAVGAHVLGVFRDLDDPDRFVVVEKWESREAFQNYFNWRKSTGSLESMAERLAAPLEVNAYEGPLVSGKGSGVAA